MNGENLTKVVGEKEAIIFDLFHTLTALESTGSSAPVTFEILGVSVEEWNEQLLERSRERLVGKEKDPFTIIEKMAHAIDPTISREIIENATRNRISRFEGALVNIPPENTNILRELKDKGMRLGLISNADVTEVAAWDKSPISSIFESAIFSCHVGFAKPEKEIYEICLRELQVTPEDSIFIGDGGSDELQGARNAGMTTVMITGVIKEI